jgi:hypothetical protein
VDVGKVKEISENQGKIRTTLGITFSWKEGRVRFFNLWKTTHTNSSSSSSHLDFLGSLTDKEVEALWTPEIRYANMELNRFEELKSPSIQLMFPHSRSSNNSSSTSSSSNSIWYLADPSYLHNAFVIDGKNIELAWSTLVR